MGLPGEVSHRGGIVDIFPPEAEAPVRLEFFGNTIESIRSFDPASQRSVADISQVSIGPARELLAPFRTEPAVLKNTLAKLNLKGLNRDSHGAIPPGNRFNRRTGGRYLSGLLHPALQRRQPDRLPAG